MNRIKWKTGRGVRPEILADYPDLEADDIKASLEYAAAQLDHPVLVASR